MAAPFASEAVDVEALQQALEAERQGQQEAQLSLLRSAEVGQQLLSRNEELEAQNRRLDAENRRLEAELEQLQGKATGEKSNRSSLSAGWDSDEERETVKELRQQLKRSEQLCQEHQHMAVAAEEQVTVLEERCRTLDEECRKLRRVGRRSTAAPGRGLLTLGDEAMMDHSLSPKDATLRMRHMNGKNTAVIEKVSFAIPTPDKDSLRSPRPDAEDCEEEKPFCSTKSMRADEMQGKLMEAEAEVAALQQDYCALDQMVCELEEENTALKLLVEEETKRSQAFADEAERLDALLQESRNRASSEAWQKDQLGVSPRRSQCARNTIVWVETRWGISDDEAQSDEEDHHDLHGDHHHPHAEASPDEKAEVLSALREGSSSRSGSRELRRCNAKAIEAQRIDGFPDGGKSRPSGERSPAPRVLKTQGTLEDFLEVPTGSLPGPSITSSQASAASGRGAKGALVQQATWDRLLSLLGLRRCPRCGGPMRSAAGARDFGRPLPHRSLAAGPSSRRPPLLSHSAAAVTASTGRHTREPHSLVDKEIASYGAASAAAVPTMQVSSNIL
eukprot:TRINITY_DN77474_c0_g1_i1.p1 TRINITY_DN77474_c0_g1~~TRINITY_DN77474_c0_g1_i1.p1  ORF type:complete len:561 (-),score=136.01 TRINITY_DN77474_c0_g1_i1:69-1751(-)